MFAFFPPLQSHFSAQTSDFLLLIFPLRAKGHGQIIKAHITLVPKGEVITLFLMII